MLGWFPDPTKNCSFPGIVEVGFAATSVPEALSTSD